MQVMDTESPVPQQSVETQEAAEEKVFQARYSLEDLFRRRERNPLSLYGKGELRISCEQIILSAWQYRFLLPGKRASHCFPPSRIFDVKESGNFVHFQIDNGDLGRAGMCIRLRNAEIAREVVEALPSNQSESFASRVAETTSYLKQLGELNEKSYIVYALALLNVVVFVMMALNGAGFFTANPEVLIRWGSNLGPKTVTGEWWRLFTSTFIHAGILHIAFNMLALLDTGRLAERLFGHLRFVAIYVFSGICGSTLSVICNPHVNSVGASGAIFGVYGALLSFALLPNSGVPRYIAARYRAATISFILYNLIAGFLMPGVDNWAHLGGLIVGFAMGFFLARPVAEERHRSLPRLGAAALLAVVIVAGASIPLENLNRQGLIEAKFTKAMNRFHVNERRALDDYAILASQYAQKRINEVSFSAAVESRLIPQWDRMYGTFHAIPLDQTSRYGSLRDELLHYIDSRRELYRLLASGVRENDKDLGAKVSVVEGKINAEVQQISALTKQEFQAH